MKRINNVFIGKAHKFAQLVNAVIIGCAHQKGSFFIHFSDALNNVVGGIFPYLLRYCWLVINFKKQFIVAFREVFSSYFLPQIDDFRRFGGIVVVFEVACVVIDN